MMYPDDPFLADQRLGDAINGHDLDAIEAGFAQDAIDHDPAYGQRPGPPGFRQFFARLFVAFPDLSSTALRTVVDDDCVALAYELAGTHRGEYLGVAPTGRSFRIRGVQIARYRDGVLVERWGCMDERGLLEQLTLPNVAPAPLTS